MTILVLFFPDIIIKKDVFYVMMQCNDICSGYLAAIFFSRLMLRCIKFLTDW